MIAALAAALLLLTGTAHAGTSLRPLQQERLRADASAAAADSEHDTQRRNVRERSTDLDAATAQLAAARTPDGLDEKKLAAAMDALARAKAAYDATVARERATMVGAVQAEAAARAARQTLTDAVTQWSAEGEALVRAAVHAAAGDIVRSPRDHAACLDQDCSPISAREHAALVLIGAVGPAFDPKAWPAEAGQDMTLLPPAIAQRTLMRTLRDAVATATKAAQEAKDAAAQQQASVAAMQSDRSAALQALLDAYFRPTPGGHAQEVIAQAADAYTAAARKAEPPTDAITDKPSTAKKAAEEHRDTLLAFFGDAGRATQRAALLAGRGAVLTASGTALAVCRAKACAPTSGLEAAAFVVIGAAMPGAEKPLADVVDLTADRRWVFRLPQ